MATDIGESTVSKRVNLTLPDSIFEELEDWAEQQGRPTANLAAFLVEASIRAAKESGEYKPKAKK
jgi:CopG-like RHH_1 or ribbon-helix-helix domain, RHH_5